MFSSEHVRNKNQYICFCSSTKVSLINVSTMFCLPCALSRNNSLRNVKPAGHMFFWFAKQSLAKHCLSFRVDADLSEKQFCFLRAATDESQKTRNKKQETKRFSTFAVYRLRHSETKKNIAWFENQVLAEHVRKSQSTIYLKSHGCVHGFQNEVSLINFSTMFCKPCSLSRNRSLRDAKSARHMFVWFAKHCLAEHCLLFRGDADECQKQFCFVFRICLAFFDSRLWRP